ncbi:S-adenosyl-L-methionine-dependent methyltransferase [Jimgerdemannia flammicorona]|uniref:S-adenosyl-L-methionine-dependent methyltransferase n=1 Tax=Jimgerdemannia flammicorona TaxID=994334 RepID=A0A433D879_9FUNG|nr:S-adenosyl-L-methionine-dependent methyltransferase [Jimgerdemannia flammicorona]
MQHYMVKFVFDGNYEPQVKGVLKKDARILDVACGSATWILEMATEFPECEFHGIDISPIFPLEIKPVNTNFTVANVLEGIPYSDNHFDLVSMRMTIWCWNDDYWPAILAEMYRVVKPGGYVQLLEPDDTLWRVEPEKQEVWKRWNRWHTNIGRDVHIGRRIYKFIQASGFESVQRRYMSTPCNWGGPVGQLCRETWTGLMMASAPRIARLIGYSEKEFEAECNAVVEYSKSVQGYFNFHVATGRKPFPAA